MLNIFSATVVFLRIFAGYLFLNAALTSAGFFAFIAKLGGSDQGYKTYTTVTALGTLALLLIGFLVVIKSRKIAHFITRDLENDLIEFDQTSYEVLQAVGFSLLGVYVLLHAIPFTVKILASYAFPAPTNKYDVFVTPSGYKTKVPLPDILEDLTQIGLGAWLLFGSKKITIALKQTWAKGKTLGS
ncbi:hypothetical protein [Geomesophilobacter sediminis]|uniref:Uncharacterized protein n=1 Tax=Geomesophilobacter sediminis TaxID=2798584 RepID=A0A8J7LTE9_9BACT|nr:hypothetical protein [Geomesophilobacter sediminis]MBJ6723329.1 hypothetical protein [Geomesophilobacter sediminis]